MRPLSRTVRAAAIAATFSGAPSTAIAVVRGDDLLEPVRAAGTLLVPADGDEDLLLVAGGLAHVAISFWWTVVLAAVLPRNRPLLWGAVAGAAIHALDMGIIARRFPRLDALERGPQLADHVAFGMLAADRLRRCSG
jgi:hypothetical protein